MNSRQLEYFLEVARELNFTKAAKNMYVSQTAVTQQIKTLETQLGVSLFERNKKKVALTPAGKVFLDEATGILSRIDTAVERTRQASSGVTGTLNIGFFAGIGNTKLPGRIQAFSRSYPNIVLDFKSDTPTRLLRRLRSGEFDLIMTPIFEKKHFENVSYKRIFRDSLVAVVPQAHILANKSIVTRKDLRDENLILAVMPDCEIGEDSKIVESFWRLNYHPNILAKIEDIETVFMMVCINQGLTILPSYLSVTALGRERLTVIPFGGDEDYLDIIAAWLPQKENPSLDKILPYLDMQLHRHSSEEGFLWEPD